METFGERLKKLRDEKGFTQQDIADVLNVGRPTIAGYETKGKQPDYDKLIKLADYFDVSIDYLLGKSNERSVIQVDTKEKANQIADEIIKIFINTGEITREELESGRIDDKKIEKLLRKVEKAIVFNKEMDEI